MAALDPDQTRMVEPSDRAAVPPVEPQEPAAAAHARGTQVGRYVILDPAGAGGMGEVYAAYDPELDRKVALKLLPRDRADAEAEARLLREAQAMAKLSHPNVVAVYDAGTAGDRVYIAMELIDGTTLRDWSKKEVRRWSDVLAVMIAAGRGLAAAHRVGIIHRDFKPSNVMIRQDGGVRVLDFGLARKVEGNPTLAPEEEAIESIDVSASGRRSLDEHLTRTGFVTGTPAYMAPEQFAGHDLDARADQFAFAITLWEALFGQRPFRGRKLDEIARAVQRGRLRAPPPGSRVPPRVRKVIVKALHVDPNARHPSMDAFVAALERVAHPPWRRAWPIGVLAMSIGAVAFAVSRSSTPTVCAGGSDKLVGVWDDARRQAVSDAFSSVALPYADTMAIRVRERLDERAAAWVVAHRDACEATAVRGEQSEALLDRRMACLDARLAELGAVADVLVTADAAIVEKAIDVSGKLGDLKACDKTTLLHERITPPVAAIADQVADLRAELARLKIAIAAGKYQDTEPQAQQIVQSAAALGYEPLLAEALQQQGALQTALGKLEEAEATLTEALLAAERTAHDEIELRARIQLASLVGLLRADAERGALHLRFAEALTHRIDIGRDQVGTIPLVQGLLAHRAADHEAAVRQFERALADREQAFGPDDPDVAMVLVNLGAAYVMLAKLDDARATFERAVATYEKVHGDAHPLTASALHNLGLVDFKRNDYEQALAMHRRALAIWSAALPPHHPDIARARNNIAIALGRMGKREEALVQYELALEAKEATLGPTHPSVAVSRSNVADLLNQMHRYEQALPHAEKAYAIMREALPPDHLDVATVRATLGHALLGVGRRDEALGHLRHAEGAFAEQPSLVSDLADLRMVLAHALWADPIEHANARALARAAHATYEALGQAYATDRETSARWLASPTATL